jgi:hypothetical protein
MHRDAVLALNVLMDGYGVFGRGVEGCGDVFVGEAEAEI